MAIKLKQQIPNHKFASDPKATSRGNQLILYQLRMGQSKLTYVHLLKKDRIEICYACDTSMTVGHIIPGCPLFKI